MTVRQIVVGLDGSDCAAEALRWAGELAQQTGARLLAVHVFEPLSMVGKAKPPIDFAKLEAEARTRLADDWVRPASDLGIAVDAELVEGDPAQALVDAADRADADLVVVGARGLSVWKGIVLGSTSMKVPHLTRRPVTIFHGP